MTTRKNKQKQANDAKTKQASEEQTKQTAPEAPEEGNETGNDSTETTVESNNEGSTEGDADTDGDTVTVTEGETTTAPAQTNAEAPVAEQGLSVPKEQQVEEPVEETAATVVGNVLNERKAGERRTLQGFAAVVPAMAKAAPALMEALDTFIAELSPNSGSTAEQQIPAQVRFFNALAAVYENYPESIVDVNGELIKVFRTHKEGACNPAYLNRNLSMLPLTTSQLSLYEALIHLYRKAAVQGRTAAAREVDIPQIVERYRKAYPRRVTGPTILAELFKE